MVITKHALCQLAYKAIAKANYYTALNFTLGDNRYYTLGDCAYSGKRIGPKQVSYAREALKCMGRDRLALVGVK